MLSLTEELLYLNLLEELNMTDENHQPPPISDNLNTTPADLNVSECCKAVMYLGDRVKTLESELAALEKVVHQVVAQLLQRGWFHNTKAVVTEWYEALRGKHNAG